MWESMMGKSNMPTPLTLARKTCRDAPLSRAVVAPPRGDANRKFSQPPAHPLQHRGLRRLHPLKIGKGCGKAGARNDDHAIAIADDHVAGGDGRAAADDRQADGAGTALAWRIRTDAYRIDRQVQRFEFVEITDDTVGDETYDAAISLWLLEMPCLAWRSLVHHLCCLGLPVYFVSGWLRA